MPQLTTLTPKQLEKEKARILRDGPKLAARTAHKLAEMQRLEREGAEALNRMLGWSDDLIVGEVFDEIHRRMSPKLAKHFKHANKVLDKAFA